MRLNRSKRRTLIEQSPCFGFIIHSQFVASLSNRGDCAGVRKRNISSFLKLSAPKHRNCLYANADPCLSQKG